MTSQPIRTGIAATALAGMVALLGCGSGEEKTAAAKASGSPAPTATRAVAASTPAPAPVPASLRGRWRRTMTEADWKPAGGGFPRGTYRLVVDRAGGMEIYFPRTDTVDFSTQLTVDGRRLTIHEVPICASTGSYTWKATGTRLTLATMKDGCAPRDALFGGPWTRQR
jgi:hypothetical protein